MILILVIILEEFLSDTLKFVSKDDTNGLYIITKMIVDVTINDSNKYDFSLMYLKKYNNKISYSDSLFFNIKKVLDNLEIKHGAKLMVDYESRNFLSYILLSLQYDLIDLSLRITKYCNKRTLNKNLLLVLVNNVVIDEMFNKIKLKLDSTITENNIKINDDDDEDVTEIDENEDITEIDENEDITEINDVKNDITV